MAETIFSATVVCVSALFVGQAVLRLCGARRWSWLAPPVGLSVLMLIAAPGIDVPGRATTMAVVLGILVCVSIVWCLCSREHRPPLGGLLAAAPVACLTLLPFLAAGRSGILGVSVDNDMSFHLILAEMYLSQTVANLKPLYSDFYPLGPHGVAAALARGLDTRIDHSFTGMTMAIPLLNAWTVLACLDASRWLKKALVSTVVAMPFLVSAYYGQGSFKELIQAGLVFGLVIYLDGEGPPLKRGRWVPPALLVGGMLSVYSEAGAAWPVVIGFLWLMVAAIRTLYRQGMQGIVAELRAQLAAVSIGLAVFILSLLPQAARIYDFYSANSESNGILTPKDSLGNLVAPLSGWEGFGVWNSGDYRLTGADTFSAQVWIAFVVALVLFGAWRLCSRGRWMLPLAAAGSMVIWRVSMDSQSPYVVAKALMIASPLLLATAALPLAERIPHHLPRLEIRRVRLPGSARRSFGPAPSRPLSWIVASVLMFVLFVVVGVSDVRALRTSSVGSTDQADELRAASPLLHHQPTLFLGNDDFIKWELPGVPVEAPWLRGTEEVPHRAEKGWDNGMPLDFDTVDARTLNSFAYVITTNDPAGSQPPPQMRLIESTQNFQIWKRVGEVRERSILPEGEGSGAVLNCGTSNGRKILRAGGVAAVRPEPVVVEGPTLTPNEAATVYLPLSSGEWAIESSTRSRLPITVTGGGIETTLEPNDDPAGPRFPIGKLVVRGRKPVPLTFKVASPLFARAITIGEVGKVTATLEVPESVVPIRQACSRYVDWYRSAWSDR